MLIAISASVGGVAYLAVRAVQRLLHGDKAKALDFIECVKCMGGGSAILPGTCQMLYPIDKQWVLRLLGEAKVPYAVFLGGAATIWTAISTLASNLLESKVEKRLKKLEEQLALRKPPEAA